MRCSSEQNVDRLGEQHPAQHEKAGGSACIAEYCFRRKAPARVEATERQLVLMA